MAAVVFAGVDLGGGIPGVSGSGADACSVGGYVGGCEGSGGRRGKGCLYPEALLGGEAGWSWWQVVYCVGAGAGGIWDTVRWGLYFRAFDRVGLVKLSPGSLVATVAFFVGGLVMTHLVFPYLIPFLAID